MQLSKFPRCFSIDICVAIAMFSKINCTFSGWRPRKTLIFANFGARNYGFLGAQKWLEVDRWSTRGAFFSNLLDFQDNFDNIPLKTALYINVAGCGNGSLKIESSHSVATAVISAMNAINYTYSDIIPSAKPETGNIDERCVRFDLSFVKAIFSQVHISFQKSNKHV